MKRLKNSDPNSYWNLLNKYSGEKKNILHKISCEVFYDHFSKLNNLQVQNEGQFEEINLDLVSNYNKELNQPFTIDEIKRALTSLNNNKASSPLDNILNEYLKHLPPFMLQITCKLFNIMFDS